MKDLGALAAAERRDLAEFLRTLSDADWHAPSLCAGWTVHDIAGHVPSYDALGWPALLTLFARNGFSLVRCNQARVERTRTSSPAQLVATLEAHAVPRGVTALFGGAIALTDTVIHHQDIRRALGHARTVPSDRLVAALGFVPRARALPAPANVRGLRLVATDVDWSHGSGPEVTGPGEAILMAAAGREQALAELGGDGVATLRERVARPS